MPWIREKTGKWSISVHHAIFAVSAAEIEIGYVPRPVRGAVSGRVTIVDVFIPAEMSTFRFLPFEFDEATGTARFRYAFDDAIEFVEEIRFPLPEDGIDDSVRQAVDRALLLLSLVAGISYYKAAVPEKAVIESGPVTESELQYLRELYFHGLGEFAYVNGLDLRDRPQFEAELIAKRTFTSVATERRSLVAVGGGKDSCVSIEGMRANGSPVLLASVNRMRPILDVIGESGLPAVHIDRVLSPELLRINKVGALNGHVPITALVSLALVVTALMHRCDAVVMSNERSASVGNVEHNGVVVNHQYSKSFEAEVALAGLVQSSIAPELEYFSLLRPLSELEITRRFSKLNRYHRVFTSCNRAFRIDESRRVERWCGDCAKCRFVSLCLAPFVSPTELTAIVGVNVLDDPAQAAGFDELIGWNAFKPFDCVGEVEESVAALLLLGKKSEWQGTAIVGRFHDEILPKLTLPTGVEQLPFVPSSQHQIPNRFQGALDATA